MKSLNLIRNEALKTAAFSRSALFYLEALPIQVLYSLVRGEEALKPPKDYNKALGQAVEQLVQKDIQNISQGIYPASVLLPEQTPAEHALSYGRLLWDSIKSSERRRKKEHNDFSKEAQFFLNELPTYYRRNFHFQTDGYLSKTSALLYDHQVEILFRGTSHAMRRLILPAMKQHFNKRGLENPRILEIGCGTGSFTRFLSSAFPQAKITAVDLSYPYLKLAQSRLKSFPRIDWIQGDGANLPFKDNQFDAVVSVFLFHELPEAVRIEVIREKNRVIKPGGFLGLVDSVQKGDVPDLEWGLEAFPKDFHEPFYKNYLIKPMEQLIEKQLGTTTNSSIGFLSKAVWLTKGDEHEGKTRDHSGVE